MSSKRLVSDLRKLREIEYRDRKIMALQSLLNATVVLESFDPPHDAPVELLRLGAAMFDRFAWHAVLLLEAPGGLPEC